MYLQKKNSSQDVRVMSNYGHFSNVPECEEFGGTYPDIYSAAINEKISAISATVADMLGTE